jgi:hypothetical protein
MQALNFFYDCFSIVHLNHDTKMFLVIKLQDTTNGGIFGSYNLVHTSTSTTFHPSPCGKGYKSCANLLEKNMNIYYDCFSSEGAL